jgi:hypothetical protein
MVSMTSKLTETPVSNENMWLAPEPLSTRDPLLPSTIILVSKNCLCCELSGEMVILSAETGTYFGLDRMGVFIWNLIQEPATLASIRDAVMNRFEVDQKQCEEDLKDFVRDLLEHGLAEIKM